MGNVIVSAKVENLEDLYAVLNGRLTPDEVRTLDVTDALVDAGAIGLMVPTRLLPQLGLRPTHRRRGRFAGRGPLLQMHEAVRLVVQDRECKVEVYEIPDSHPLTIGMIPLGALDLVVDASSLRTGGVMSDLASCSRP